MLMNAQCRPYLLMPPGPTAAGIQALRATLARGDVACILLRPGAGGTFERALAQQALAVARDHDVATLIDGDVETAAQIDADGVHVTPAEDAYTHARRLLGDDKIVGVGCGISRHDAMVHAEKGADYIALTAGDDHDSQLDWWAELFEVPCVAWPPYGPREIDRIAQSGAEFIALPPEIWQGADTETGGRHGLMAAEGAT